MTTTLTTEAYAATYADGEAGVDVITQEVERDEDGTELSRTEASWAWHGQSRPVGTVDFGQTDEWLYQIGYSRTSPWKHHDDLGGSEGWTAQVEVR